MKSRALVMVAALVFAAGACGGDDDDVADGAAATSDASDDGGDSGGEWCDVARGVEAEGNLLDDVDFNDRDALESAYQDMIDVFENAADAAPDEIKDDVQLTIDRTKELFGALQDADFDILDVDQAVLEDPEADAATNRIEAYNERECGIVSDSSGTSDTSVTDDTGAGTDDGASVSVTGTVRDELVRQLMLAGMTEEQATCLADNLDMDEVAANGANDPTMFINLFETCNIDPSKLTSGG